MGFSLFRGRGSARSTGNTSLSDADRALLSMVMDTQAVIRFQPDGTILGANDNFLAAMGYSADEVVGRHHRMFVDEAYAASDEYADFWDALGRGDSFTDIFPRVTKSGDRILIQATYAPVSGPNGQVEQVVKIATDVTLRQGAVEALTAGLEKASRGDLSWRAPPSQLPDVGKLVDAYNATVARLSDMVERLQGLSDGMNATTQQISNSSDDLARRTESQAATLEQSTAAVAQLSDTAKEAAQRATDMADKARSARSRAEEGGQTIAQVSATMDRIDTSSSQISQIISVIDDIAFQTNLLALNAGVEAARAGEAGRGFAVVASEVRTLAQRASDSAQEIKGLITASATHVADGVEQVGRAETEFGAILDDVRGITDSVGDITKSLRDQSTTLEEIRTALTHLDQATQENTVMVQDTARSLRDLTGHARIMADEVSFFETSTGTSSGSADTGVSRRVA